MIGFVVCGDWYNFVSWIFFVATDLVSAGPTLKNRFVVVWKLTTHSRYIYELFIFFLSHMFILLPSHRGYMLSYICIWSDTQYKDHVYVGAFSGRRFHRFHRIALKIFKINGTSLRASTKRERVFAENAFLA